MGVFVTARIIGHHASYNMSRTSRETAPFVFKTLAAIAESAVFFLLGAAPFAYNASWNPCSCFVTVVACLVARVFAVVPLAWLCNLTRTKSIITWQMQTFMWYSGSRGAIAFGLVVILHGTMVPGSNEAQVAEHLLTAVLATVLFTVLVMGSGAAKLLCALGLDKKDVMEEVEALQSYRTRVPTDTQYGAVDGPGGRRPNRRDRREGENTTSGVTCRVWLRLFERRYIERYVRRPKVVGDSCASYRSAQPNHATSRRAEGGEPLDRTTTPATPDRTMTPPAPGSALDAGDSTFLSVPNAQFVNRRTDSAKPQASNAPNGVGSRRDLSRGTLYSDAGFDQTDGDDSEEEVGFRSWRPYELSRLF
jgi:hypothetical protein